MADFSIISRFDPNANFKLVQIGSDAPVLEAELNELQEIADTRLSLFMKGFVGNGLSTIKNMNYDPSTKTFTMEDNIAFLEGVVIPISTLSVKLSDGETAYLKMWEKTITGTDIIPYYGNIQETRFIENYIVDSRIAMETSRRVQIQYDLVKSTDELNCFYLPICTVNNGLLNVIAKITHNYDTLDGGDFNSQSESIIDCGYF